MKRDSLLLLVPLIASASGSNDYIIKVKTDNNGSSQSDAFTIPITRTSGDGYNVDCNNDGINEAIRVTTDDYPDGYTCQYGSEGNYTIRIEDNNGDNRGFRRIRFYIDSDTTTDVLKLLEIKQWGSAEWSSMAQAYRGAINLTVTPSDIPDLSKLTSLKQMFQGCSNADINTSEWDTSSITNLSGMFRDAIVANPDVSEWDTSNVTNISQMFYNASSAVPDVSNWETSSVTDMSSVFRLASNANPNVSEWNTSNVTQMQNMFKGALNATPDTSTWHTASVTRMDGMFQDTTSADPNTSDWNTSFVTQMQDMFRNASLANPNTSDWNTSSVTRMDGMFQGAVSATPNTSNWDTSSVVKMNNMFRDAILATPDVSNFNTAQVTTMYGMFYNAHNALPNTTTWDTSQVTNMAFMFCGTSRANPDTTQWDTSSVTTMRAMFKDATSANPNITDWNVSSVTNMGSMFQNAVTFDQNLYYWDVSNVTNFRDFLDGVKLSTYHYDSLLQGWAKLTLSSDETFDGGDSNYCEAESQRDEIISNYNWTFNDNGKSCPKPCEEVMRPLKAYHWTLISFPCDTGMNSIETLLSNALGTYGNENDWVMYEQSGTDDYSGKSTTKKRMLEANDTVKPGKGYWIITATDRNMTIDTTLSDLNFTAVQPASNFDINDTAFDDLNHSRIPDSSDSYSKKIMLGNPFPKEIDLSHLYFSHGGDSGSYHPIGDDYNDAYLYSTIYTYDHTGTQNSNYIAITPITPGFSDKVDPMTGFFLILKSDQNGSNYLTFPYEK